MDRNAVDLLFGQMSEEDLRGCYDEYLSLSATGVCRNQPLRRVLDAYLEAYGPNAIYICTTNLLAEIARRYYAGQGAAGV